MIEKTTVTKYRPDIDGLRAFSIIAVVIYHAFPSLLPGGFVGVDVFFVISGYLITRIIIESISKETFSILGFYRRRIQRILPALILVLLFCLLAGWFVLLPLEYQAIGKHTGSASLFVPNIVYWTESGYFDVDSKLKPLLHLWSLGIEEQFYLFWPLLLLVSCRFRGGFLWMTIAALAVSFALNINAIGDRSAAFFLPQYRVWEMIFGALIASVHLRTGLKFESEIFGSFLSAIGLLILFASVATINNEMIFPGWWALLPVIGASLVIASPAETQITRPILANPIMVFVGKISFPLYLWHWPLLSFARIMEDGEPDAIVRTFAVVLAIALAWVSNELVEKRLRYHEARLTPILLLLSLLGIGAVGFVVMNADGFPHRTAEQNELASKFNWKDNGVKEAYKCTSDFGRRPYCLTDSNDPRIAVIGDSHATNVFLALSHHYRNSDVGVMRLQKESCPPLYNVRNSVKGDEDFCLNASNGNIDWIMENPGIDVVYLSSMGPMYLQESKKRFSLSTIEDESLSHNADVFLTGLNSSVSRFTAAGKQVVLVIDWPSLSFFPTECVDIRPMRITPYEPEKCVVERQDYEKRAKSYREIILSVVRHNPGIQYWDTKHAFCDKQYCYGQIDGDLLYRDKGHLTIEGSRYLGARLKLEKAPATEGGSDH